MFQATNLDKNWAKNIFAKCNWLEFFFSPKNSFFSRICLKYLHWGSPQLPKEQTKPNFSGETEAEAEIRVPLKGNRNDFLEFRFRSCRNQNLVIKFGFNRILTEFKPKFKNQKEKEN